MQGFRDSALQKNFDQFWKSIYSGEGTCTSLGEWTCTGSRIVILRESEHIKGCVLRWCDVSFSVWSRELSRNPQAVWNFYVSVKTLVWLVAANTDFCQRMAHYSYLLEEDWPWERAQRDDRFYLASINFALTLSNYDLRGLAAPSMWVQAEQQCSKDFMSFLKNAKMLSPLLPSDIEATEAEAVLEWVRDELRLYAKHE